MQAIIIAALFGTAAQGAGDKVELVRKFKSGEKTAYAFVSDLNAASREGYVDTFIPENIQFTYDFTLSTEKELPEGTAQVRFQRPKISIKEGETFESPPKTTVAKLDHNLVFTLSKTNRVLGVKDETPKKSDKGKGGGFLVSLERGNQEQDDPISSWIQFLYQFGAFVNFYDLGPELPDHAVAVGDIWKQTVGYQPMQMNSGADKGKPIMGRLDMVYTYNGTSQLAGKSAIWIQATLHNESDAAPFIADQIGVKLDEMNLKSVKLQLNAAIDYYLDPANLQVMRIESKSDGFASIEVKGFAGPIREEKFKSAASLTRK